MMHANGIIDFAILPIQSLDERVEHHVRSILIKTQGNQAATAEILKITRSSMRRVLQRHNINPWDYRPDRSMGKKEFSNVPLRLKRK